jgi:hypothetical protein
VLAGKEVVERGHCGTCQGELFIIEYINLNFRSYILLLVRMEADLTGFLLTRSVLIEQNKLR